jgi:hypothetical protein
MKIKKMNLFYSILILLSAVSFGVFIGSLFTYLILK